MSEIPEYVPEANPHKGNKGVLRAWRAMINSWDGLVYAVREESAFRQELTLALCLIPIAILLPFDAIERLMLTASVIFVLVVELLNSSVEAAVDRISFEHHGLSKRAKDYGSAAVMLALLMCGLVWITLTIRLLGRS